MNNTRMNDLRIGPGTKVSLHFSLSLEDGTVIDSNFDKEPASFSVGDGSLLEGFEKKIYGMAGGEKAAFTIKPEEGFGQPNPSNIQRFERKDFSADVELVEGLMISFADASQSELPGVVKSLDGDLVYVDFNHPLAGRDIEFSVAILDVSYARG